MSDPEPAAQTPDARTGEDIRYVRATHPHAFKSGEWGQIVGERDRNGRMCWLIVWPDGRTDEWVLDDPHAGYEFSEVAP